MDFRRTLIAVALSILVLLGWTWFFSPQQPQTPPAPQTAAKPEPAPTTAAPVKASPTQPPAVKAESPQPAATPQRPAKAIEIQTQLASYKLTEMGGRLVSVKLNGIREAKAKNSGPKELIKIEDPGQAPLGLATIKNSIPGLEQAVFEVDAPETKMTIQDQDRTISFRWVSPAGVEVVKRFTFSPHSYLVTMTVEVANHGAKSLDDNLVVSLSARNEAKEGGSYAFKGFGALVNRSLVETEAKDLAKEPKVVSGKIAWGGYENSYFLQAIIPGAGEGSLKAAVPDFAEGKNDFLVQVRFTSQPFSVAPGAKQEFEFKTYFGPKIISILKAAGHDLDLAIDMGWFDVVAKPCLYFLNYIHALLGNFGLAIIILTIIVKILFWPLTQKSYKSMKAMQALQPQMLKLREKYKNDKQRLNQEMMGLYKAHKVNPMGGCLPMVIQIPVFIALYRLLDYAIELRHAPFLLWIDDLASPDRLFHFSFSVPFMDPPYGVPVLTLLMGVSMFIQQKMTPTPGDPTQAKVMLLMPIIFTFVFINFPSGLVLYWLTNNVLSIGQQLMVNKLRAKG